MRARNVTPNAAHQAFRNDAIELLRKHAADLNEMEMLALASHLVGQLVALQDRRRMTPEQAMELVAMNVQTGNAEAVNNSLGITFGSA